MQEWKWKGVNQTVIWVWIQTNSKSQSLRENSKAVGVTLQSGFWWQCWEDSFMRLRALHRYLVGKDGEEGWEILCYHRNNRHGLLQLLDKPNRWSFLNVFRMQHRWLNELASLSHLTHNWLNLHKLLVALLQAPEWLKRFGTSFPTVMFP